MGIGAFNLMISMLPSRIIKLLEIIGFSGDKVSSVKRERPAISYLKIFTKYHLFSLRQTEHSSLFGKKL